MSDSDSSCEENVEQLREAVNNEFISDSLFNKNILDTTAEKGVEKREECPSIRAQLKKEQECHPLNVTPEFQNFVAKHLSRMLDRELEEMWQDYSDCRYAHKEQNCCYEGGVRLFASSTSYVTMEEAGSSNKRKKNRQNVAVVDEHDSEEELKKCQSASVSPDWVLSKKGIEGWQKSSKGEVVTVNNKGEIVGHENAKTKIRTNSRGVKEREFHIAV